MLKRQNLPALFRPAALALGALCLLAAPGAAQADPPRPFRGSAGEIIEGLRRLEAGSALAAGSREGALDRILEGREYPGSCATPLVLALNQSRARLGAEGAALLNLLGPGPDGGRLAFPSLRESFSGSFRLIFGTDRGDPASLDPYDGDLDGVADEARSLLDRLDRARLQVSRIFEETGMATSRPDRSEPTHRVLLADLPGPLAGYVWSREGQALLVLDRERINGADGDRILVHQVAHLLQLGLTDEESPWWYEAHALWVDDPAGLAAHDRADAVVAYLESAATGLEPRTVQAWEGSFLWPHFLLASGGQPALLGAAWDEMAALPGNNTLQAMGRALEALGPATLEEAVRSFRIWNVFLGEMDDGRHYPFASELRGPVGDHSRDFPAIWQGEGPIAPLGGSILQLTANPAPGGWVMDFEGSPLARWDVTLLTIPADLGSRPGLAVLPVDEGLGSAGVPWQELAGVIVVVQNLGSSDEEPARFLLEAAYDPLVPFDLMSFSATDEGNGAVALRWHTEREMNMLGWQLYRSRDPLSGFEPVQELLIPAVGGPDAASYMILDQGLAPGRKYYYLLEGITQQGFREVAYPVAVRVRPGR